MVNGEFGMVKPARPLAKPGRISATFCNTSGSLHFAKTLPRMTWALITQRVFSPLASWRLGDFALKVFQSVVQFFALLSLARQGGFPGHDRVSGLRKSPFMILPSMILPESRPLWPRRMRPFPWVERANAEGNGKIMAGKIIIWPPSQILA